MVSTGSRWAVVVAGGSGLRFGRRKQLAELAGRRVIDWSIAAMRPHVDGVVTVLPADLVAEDTDGATTSLESLDADRVVAGGPSRSASVRAGLEAVPTDVDQVLIHDAARPLTSADVVARVCVALGQPGTTAVVPVVPVTDSLRRRDGPAVDRTDFVAVQTPQGFDRAAILDAHRSGRDASDDATLIDEAGGTVVQVDGDPDNLKITDPGDLGAAALVLARLEATSVEARAAGPIATDSTAAGSNSGGG